MVQSSHVYSSLLVSISTQFIVGIWDILALLTKVPTKLFFIKQLLWLELIVQIIEGSFYAHWFKNFHNYTNITPLRYYDWAISTPTMLITLIFYLIFLKNKDGNLNFFKLLNQESYTLIVVLLLNWLMLLFGYLGEIKKMPTLLSVFLGFIPFLIYYFIIYKKYANLSEEGFKIFFYFFIVWSFYGLVAMLPYKLKNTCYNILDLFAKNFFGIFLGYLVFKNRK